MRTCWSLLVAAVAMTTLFCATVQAYQKTDPYPTGPWTPYHSASGGLDALREWAVKETYNPLLHFVGVESGRYHDRVNNRVDWDLTVIASARAGDNEKYTALVLADQFMTPLDLVSFDHYRPH